MKRGALFSFLLLATSAAYAVPSMHVTVSDPNGKPAYRGATNADGTFATGNLPPSQYVVQFTSKDAAATKDQYLLVISAGKKNLISNTFAGEKFTSGGAAVKLDLAAVGKISGQVVSAQALAAAKVRIINGKRYRWVEAETGSNLRGHLAEEGRAGAHQVVIFSTDEIRKIQDRGDSSVLLHR
ncbi:MAG: carboxypeptidase-like regulatory domain-containing protein [Verrucomicrobiota bacterium]|nr:carboxypeptidase-like regulatory domain-containing protein [Verrucomicrobiota bacterium]